MTAPKTLLLHIGTTKTGNTSIHRSLVRAQTEGQLGPVCYPRWKGELHQARMAVLYCPEELGEMLPSLRERYPASDRSFKRMLRQYRDFVFQELRSANTAILSAETFSHMFSRPLAIRLRDDMESLGFRQFHVVLYVRDPADYYLSSMSQSLRMSDGPPFIKDPASFRYEFLRIADTWEHAFPGRLVVRKYPSDPHQDVIEDFSSVLERLLGVSLPQIPARSNTSISAEAMQILDDYRRTFWPDNGGRLTPDTARLVQFLRNSAQPQTKPALKPGIAEQIRANHLEDAKALSSRYGVDLGLRSGYIPAATALRGEPYRVEDIVEHLDPDIAHRLLLELGRAELGNPQAQRPLVHRVAARTYRKLRQVTGYAAGKCACSESVDP